MSYKIFDWAGNDKTDFYGTFNSLEDALERLYEEFDHLEDSAFDEQMQEFEICKSLR